MYISPSETDGNMRPKLAIFRLSQTYGRGAISSVWTFTFNLYSNMVPAPLMVSFSQRQRTPLILRPPHCVVCGAVATLLVYKGGSRVGERGAEVEVPQTPRGWGLGRRCPLPNGGGSGEGAAPLPRNFFEFLSRNGVSSRSATYDFILTFYGNYGRSRTVYEMNGDFSRKSQIFPTPVYFAHKLTGSPWNWVLALGVQKKLK